MKTNLKLIDNKSQLKVFYVVSVILLLIDQVSKVWAQKVFQNQPPVIFLNDLFRFEYAENPGAFLGMGNTLSDPMRFWIFVILVFFLMAGLAIYIHIRDIPKIELWAYTFVFAGGVGNLIDRVFRAEGRVIDFMNMGIGSLRTGIFNIADMAIMAGLFLLIISSKNDKPGKKT